jgi:hypothetical protein
LATANPICLTLFEQLILRAASRAAWTAGSNRPTKIPMIAMTTSNSTSVKARRCFLAQPNFLCIKLTPKNMEPMMEQPMTSAFGALRIKAGRNLPSWDEEDSEEFTNSLQINTI